MLENYSVYYNYSGVTQNVTVKWLLHIRTNVLIATNTKSLVYSELPILLGHV